MIRVLVADDSPTTRVLLSALLAGDPGVSVVGEAADGAEAVERTRALRPDVVVMDVHMPRLDGYEATRRIMVEAATPIVIVSAGREIREVQALMRALQAGAVTALPKPLADDPDEQARFVATVKAMSAVKVVRRWPEVSPVVRRLPASVARVECVAIGASTGGPAVLARLLAELGPSFPAPVLVVQHMATGFVQGLAAWLSGQARARVTVAVEGEVLEPGRVYVAPDGSHLGVEGGRVALLDTPAVGGFRPSATVLFASVASAFGPGAVGVVLTGMGSDGLEGARALRDGGGRVIAQDEASCVVYGMPAVVVKAGLAHDVLPPPAIARRLIELATREEEA